MTIGDKMARGMQPGAASSPLETRADTRYIIILSLVIRSDPRAPHMSHVAHNNGQCGKGESVFIISGHQKPDYIIDEIFWIIRNILLEYV